MKILLAEDEEHIAKMVVFKLNKAGYEVTHAENGEEAIAMAKGSLPDLILLDVMMPIFDGFEVLKQLKELEGLKDTPVIMLTAKSEEEDTLKGFDLGATDYMVKPFRPAELLARVKRVLGEAWYLKCIKLKLHRLPLYFLF